MLSRREMTSADLLAMSRGEREWPAWAVVASLFRQPADTGVGDTIRRELGDHRTEPFKRHHEAIFGIMAKPCGCAGKVSEWNRSFPYAPGFDMSDFSAAGG